MADDPIKRVELRLMIDEPMMEMLTQRGNLFTPKMRATQIAEMLLAQKLVYDRSEWVPGGRFYVEPVEPKEL